ncbi:hypothetical protein EST38_g12256 [Candolleomyces aberdarensis]|uniref:MYND-type domain-containing protein n=1 Tax=Candolleomyces aberdarensis TaxID=2316362 RepID=A0A4Q2D5Z2_9AGAR|nr:hypothetical protein EST38_g12256 [Candolleomyces aberdarensis]
MRFMLWLLIFLLVSRVKAVHLQSLNATEVNQTVDSTFQEEDKPAMKKGEYLAIVLTLSMVLLIILWRCMYHVNRVRHGQSYANPGQRSAAYERSVLRDLERARERQFQREEAERAIGLGHLGCGCGMHAFDTPRCPPPAYVKTPRRSQYASVDLNTLPVLGYMDKPLATEPPQYSRRKPKEALPYLMKALEDRRNLDAILEFAFLAPTKDESVEILEEGVARGKRILLTEWLGPKAFDDDGDCVGHFWGRLETRPYMRVMQALSRMYFETEKHSKAAEIQIEMLRLCPGDNMGVRQGLGSSLIRVKRYADALSFAQVWLDTFDDGSSPPRGGTLFKEPKKTLFTETQETKLSKYCTGELIHTAALASFKLFGDCPQSQQYLRIASKVNPHILVRILGRVTRPTEPNRYPRSMNGPEEAHDYLWISQDLWETEDAWNWANTNPDARATLLKTCSRGGCGVKETSIAQFKRCAACRTVSYCSVECQKLDWKRHKPSCLERQRLAAQIKLFSKPMKDPKGKK